MNDTVLVLQWSFRQDEFGAGDDQPLSLIEIRRDDDIGNARLLFHRKEDESFGGTGTLPCNDTSGDPYKLTVSVSPQFLRRKNSLHTELLPRHARGGLSMVNPVPA